MPSAAPDNANPVIHQSSSRRKTRSHHLNLDDDDDWDRKANTITRTAFVDDEDDELWVSGEQGLSTRDEIDQDEIFGKHHPPWLRPTPQPPARLAVSQALRPQ